MSAFSNLITVAQEIYPRLGGSCGRASLLSKLLFPKLFAQRSVCIFLKTRKAVTNIFSAVNMLGHVGNVHHPLGTHWTDRIYSLNKK